MNNNNKKNGNSRLNLSNGQSSDDDSSRASRSNNVSLFDIVDIDNNDTGEQENMNEDNDTETERTSATTAPRRSRIRRYSLISTDDDIEWRGSNPDWLETSDGSSSNQENSTTSESRKKSPHASPKVLSIPKPKHNWFVVKEVLKRETGDFRAPISFPKRFYGSLHAVQRLELMYKLERHSGCVNAINFNRSGTTLISGSDDRMVAVWNWTEGKCLSAFPSGHTGNVFQCKFLPYNDGHIVTCSRDGQVRLALRNNTGTYETSESLAQHTRACHKISVINQEPYLVISAGSDAQVFQIDVREKKPQRLLFVKDRNKKVSLYSVHVNPATGNEFCLAGEDTYVRIYDRRYISRNGSSLKFSPNHLAKPFAVYVTCAVFNYNGTEVMGSYNDDDIYLFDAKHATGSTFVHRYEGHRNSETVKGVNFFGPKSEYVVSGSDCGNIYFWDKNTEAIVQWMRGDEEGVINCLEPHPRIPVLATSGLDSDVKIWVPSCEQEPSMDGLSKVVTQNRKKRSIRGSGSRSSLNDTLVRWWRQMRYLHRHEQQSLRDGAPIFIEIGSLGAFGRFGDYVDSSNSGSSSSDSSNSGSLTESDLSDDY